MSTITDATAKIVIAYVGNHPLPEGVSLPGLISVVHAALAESAGHVRQPVVEGASEFSDDTPDLLQCRVCGERHRMLKRHIVTHKLDPDSYRSRFGLPPSYSLTAPDYALRRRDIAIQHGLGHRHNSFTVRRQVA